MNKFDKNFHLNFLPLYATFLFMLFMLWASEVNADESKYVEEIVVVAEQSQTVKINPVTSSRVITSIVPAWTYGAGGYGGFVGYNVTGAQTVHTTVYTNGVPSNDPGNGWYDFAHDMSSGQTVKVISGPNGVIYGSGSLAGTVLVEETIDRNFMYRYGDSEFVSVAPTENFQVTYFDGFGDSVRNDNDEQDGYRNVAGKTRFSVGEFTVDAKHTDYSYDYDNCFDTDFNSSNDCVQQGEKLNVSIRNDNFTFGRSETKSEYFTEGLSTTLNEGSRDYFRFINTSELSSLVNVTYGLDYSSEKYNEYNLENFGAFVSTNININGTDYNFGVRQGNENQNALRFGMQRGLFYASGGTSFRRPNLYELNGDGWINANPGLAPEEGEGFELGYGSFGLFSYKFDETIDYDVVNSMYYNAGSYTSQGAKYSQAIGPFSLSIRYTDTEQPRIPKYQIAFNYRDILFEDIEVRAKYTINKDRAPSLFDGGALEDLEKLNFYITKNFNKAKLSLKIENVLDEEVEILPFYNNEGREFYLTFQYIW